MSLPLPFSLYTVSFAMNYIRRSVCTMVYTTKYRIEERNGIHVVVSYEQYSCKCGGLMRVRGSCLRSANDILGNRKVYKIRVLQCSSCLKCHRELPDILVNRKHYDRQTVTSILQGNNNVPCEDSTIRRIANQPNDILEL